MFQVKRYIQRQLTNTLSVGRTVGGEAVQLSTLKAILLEQAIPKHHLVEA